MYLPMWTMQQPRDGAGMLGELRLGRLAGRRLGLGLGMRPMRAFVEDALAAVRVDRQGHQHVHIAWLEAAHGERAAGLERLEQRCRQMRRGMHLGAIGEQQAIDIGLGIEQKTRQGAAGFREEIRIDPMHCGLQLGRTGQRRQVAPDATQVAWRQMRKRTDG
ncbi:hypothetical protein XVE_3421 [Xanthomonas vesicatoria ATCC 35937]|uniref:Uncharacterized protein n=1 Tax=Xanthomonas vesicatoria ATCC 35937 TaxID=925775 RepID=F0BGP4_9XANT|nr:hypothetical protein XVE_3421 [Xanthomonas vesicatoria ATCC 35937]